MSDKINPTSNDGKSFDFLPKFYQSDANKKFLQATVDQLTQSGTVKKINGYIGRENAKASTGADVFIEAPTTLRQNYQLEPGLVIEDTLGNNTFFKDYQDYINQIKVFGGNLDNHSRVNKQEFYSWDPHIDWDKFINFQQYYWLPYGPDVITIAGQAEEVTSEFNITVEPEGDNNTYIFWPNGLDRNPTIKLYRGQTYKFNITSPGNPFSIKTRRTPGAQDRYQTVGLEGAAVEDGVITFTVPYSSPDVLFYMSETDSDLGGVFEVLSIDENTAINIETEILGKLNYKLTDGTALSNGMKVRFIGTVTPAEYATGFYYVEGVGTSIKLVKESILEIVSSYTTAETILFDSIPFDSKPFGDATSFAGTRDYVVINRGSLDHNPWSRNNRWFHKDVIETSAKYNGQIPNIDQNARAVRPIIEFEAGLKLFNFGTHAIPDVDLVDTYTKDVFSNIEGQLGYNIDGIQLSQGQRILFTADTDRLVKNKIYRVTFTNIQGRRQIHLELDTTPTTGNVVLIRQGNLNQGVMYWFDGDSWTIGQQKLTLNQSPLFDIFDKDGVSYGNASVYDGSTFKGTKIYSYKVGTGTVDANLGFPLAHKNINNIGDIVFNFNLLSDTFQYKTITDVITQKINIGYLLKTLDNSIVEYVNGWQTSVLDNTQAAVRIYKNTNKVNNFDLDIFNDITDLSDLVVKVYVNGIRLGKENWSVVNGSVYKRIILNTNILTSDVLTIRAFAKQPINNNGYYEIPINLQNNPLNDLVETFTLGEVGDHLGSIVDNLETFVGSYPGSTNLRDAGNITPYGTKFVQHSGPASLSLYHITSESNNIIRAIEQGRDDYNKFKRNFIVIAESLGVDTNVIDQVDLVLEKINKDKPKTAPYYFSDMVPYGASIKSELTVVDYRIKTYPLTNTFNLTSLSTKAVIVYLNGEQLLVTKDYTFNDQGFILINNSVELQNGDAITIYEYDNTNGCFIPPTPTKLGIWPKYEPKIYLDTTLMAPQLMIQGHDGSQVLAYGDYRDDLILELEKRIYNNIKVQYNPDIFDIYNIIPSYNRKTDYSLEEFNDVLAPSFYKWLTLVDKDFTKPLSYDRSNPMTFNYTGYTSPDGRKIPGWWRGVYRWMLDTDRPNICPWEMLGFTEEPTWWQKVYGPAPYTSDNKPLWTDLSTGTVREPGVPPAILKQFVRPFLAKNIPVDESGNIISPLLAGLAEGTITNTTSNDFVFGDVSPVESAWRRSSHYPFSILLSAMLLQPAKTFGTLLDRSRIVRNLAGQLVYSETDLRVRLQDLLLPSIYSSTTNVQTAGIINYIVDYILSDNLKSYNAYQYDLKNINSKLSYRIGAFTSKEKFNLILDSKTPLSQGSVFVPQEDYSIILNTSSPVKKITYSGVIITKVSTKTGTGFEVKGYSATAPYFKYYPWTSSGVTINVGGISESYSVWTAGYQYATGKIVEYNNRYYRSKALHTAGSTFDSQYYQVLPSLPVTGGRSAVLRKSWDRNSPITTPYGTTFYEIQDVFDFLLGYGEYLKDQGFIFDDFNTTLNAVTNWETSAKEFLFWTTQNWSTGEDKWEDWTPNNSTAIGEIVRYNGEYYRALRNSPASPIFIEENFTRLNGLSTVGSSVLSLSPSATKITFSTPLSVVNDITNSFNSYEIFKVDGTPLEPNFINSYRQDNAVSYSPSGNYTLFGASFYLIQQEQVVILNNTTMFNDTIYNPTSGYRQERIKVSGYTSANWYGGFDIPGFIFDQAKIQSWEAWQDYALGDIVKYKEFYYSANSFLVGTQSFEDNNWIKLDKTPAQALLPNWSYKAGQFTDFYSLDSDNFDSSQQQLAQHLIGYQKRQYLDNIIKDDVSEFKFYQGMITEKGTQNVLNKLFDVLSAADQESLSFYEEWALRVGQYGASSAYENIEFKLDESLFKNNPQGIELVSSYDKTLYDFIIRQKPNDIYLKPLGYNNNPWPVIDNYTPFLRTPGYVRYDEVNATLTTLSEILTLSVGDFKNGDYVWCGFEGPSWNVYRYSNVDIKVTGASYTGTKLTITASTPIPFSAGDYIGIDQVSSFSGFYQVSSVSLNTFTVITSISNWKEPFVEQDKILIFSLRTQRADSIDVADTLLPTDIHDGELLWTDDNGSGKWTVWQHKTAYSTTEIYNSVPQEGLSFGRKVLINPAGNIAAISNSQGEIVIYDKASPTSSWIQRQTIVPPFISINGLVDFTSATETGDVLAISTDGKWFATGTPTAKNVASRFVGSFSLLGDYVTGDIVSAGTISEPLFYRALADNHGAVEIVDGNLIPSRTYWKKIPYIPVDPTGENSSLINQGVISIYKKDNNNIFTLVDTILSPVPSSNKKFGSNLIFGNNCLFVGASGHNNNTGKLYKLVYKTTVEASTFYNPPYSVGTTITVASTSGIEVGMGIIGTGFTTQTVTAVVNSTTIKISSAPSEEPTGLLQFTVTQWQYDLNAHSLTPAIGSQETIVGFGTSVAMSKDASTLLVNAPRISVNNNVTPTIGRVYVYKLVSGEYTLSQTLQGTEINYGTGLTVSDYGDYIAISSIFADLEKIDQGNVVVYKYNGSAYANPVSLTNVRPESAEFFGTKISFMNDYKTLVVYSQNADSTTYSSIDSDTTTFDNFTTRFVTTEINGGRVDIYDRYGTKWIYSESLTNTTKANDGYGAGFAVGSNHVFVGAPYTLDQDLKSGRVYEYSKTNNTYSWSVLHEQIDKPDVSKIKQAFLYNTATNKLITYLDVLDSNQGKIPGIASQEIKYKTFYDPAIYSVGNSKVNVDDGMAWAKDQVGMLWWDLSTAKFLDSSDNDVVYRNSTWNTLFKGASIDVYEWVSSTLTPDKWNEQADTEAGLALGISGTTLYDNTVYSVVKRYDNVAKTFKNTYYYWVKNKKTIPSVNGRMMSAQDVSDLIENPRGYGYKYLALTSTNSFSLVNIKPLLQDSNVVLSVEYWTVDNIENNIHTQWKLISTDAESSIPESIEQKWFDSLSGKDTSGRVVPDATLPIKLRYGIENRPRQGMFINRFEALKQVIEQINRVLISERIAEQKDLSLLDSYDAEPNVIKGTYDTVLDTDAELRFAGVSTFKKPSLTPIIVDGRITGINIIDRGNGYIVAPYIDVTGSGAGAILRATINARGQITGATIVSSGQGYDSSTLLTVRNYSILIHSDSQASGNWSVYAYEPLTQVWSRVQSQTYDTRKYWNYYDWYDTGYNQFTAVDFAVSTLAELNTITVNVGQLVKVLTNNNGNWTLLYKYADSTSVDWTQSYKVIGLQNGTIQFSPSLYQFSGSVYGYDGSLYDGSIFDNVASTELRNILTAIKQNILIDELRHEYLNLFFTSVRYTLSEQNYIDWAFKTSFVKVHHNVGDLKQKVTYNNDNLTDFESYVDEVKPYRTKVREYVSNYSNVDTGKISTTDFDLPPVYENNKLMPMDVRIVNGKIVASSNKITEYPWKHWLDNAGFTITSLKIVDGGSGYVSEPVVRFISQSGSGATARAFITNGVVNRIILLTPGSGYLSAPEILLDGGLSLTGTAATAVAIIGNSPVRSTLIKMKFDRITQTYFLNQLEQTETFTGTGSRLQWPLIWGPDIRIGKATVNVNGVDALRDDYKLSIVKSTSRGYTSYSGSITFVTAPKSGASISITYLKDWSLLNAADRIQYYYNPTTGELGKDLAQLMTGIDYGGVVVSGLGFDVSAGWGELPYYTDKWDSFDPTFDDYIVSVAANTHEFTLPYVPADNEEINIYYLPNVVSSYTSTGTETTYEYSIYVNDPLIVTALIEKTVNAFNNLGLDTITLDSVAGLKIGDILTIPSVPLSVGYNAAIVDIIPSTNSIKLNQIFFTDVASGNAAYFTRTLKTPTDYVISVNGRVSLTEPLIAGATISIGAFVGGIRIDDSNFGTPDQSETAVRLPFIGDGVTNTVTIPEDFIDSFPVYIQAIIGRNTVNDGDQFILRKSTSDGSIKPQDGDYDTALSGGSFAGNYLTGSHTSALGIAADEIILDGDGFVTPTTSPAPEEVVPGQIVDTLAIKVYDRPSSGTATVKVDSFAADGITTEFEISQQPNSSQAVIVKTIEGTVDVNGKIGSISEIMTQIDDYTVDYKNRKVVFDTAPAAGLTVSIFSIGFNGTNILDLDYFVGNGVTNEFITKAPWLDSISYLVYVDGVPRTVEIFRTDTSYESDNRVGFRFINAPAADSLVSFIIVSGNQQSFSITKTERILPTGTDTYSLANIIGDSLPIESSMIVRVDQEILKGPNNSYFTIKGNRLNYNIDPAKFLPYSISTTDIVVLANGSLLTPVTDYIVDLSGITIKINRATYNTHKNQTLIVSIKQGAGYQYVPGTAFSAPQIVFNQAYDNTHTIEVISSYKHDVLDIQRTAVNITSDLTLIPDTAEFYTYKSLTYGLLELDRPVIDDNYVWVIKNGTLLTPSIDFKLNSDKQSIRLALPPDITDEFTLITFGSNILTSGIAYMQFKDMLNRVIFKRLSANKQTMLSQDLYQTDITITVDDASNFDIPSPANNKPGIIEIAGERIEYFTLEGNVLGQLRRGTLGTGVRTVHKAGSVVQDIGASETIPYSENMITSQVESDGTTTLDISFVPGGFDSTTQYNWNSKVTSLTELAQNSVEVFAGGVRMKKDPYKVFSSAVYPYSPEGDLSFDEEFTVDNTSKQVTMTAPVAFGTRVLVAKRVGSTWDSTVNIQYDTNKIAQFLKAQPGIWYTEFKQ